MVGTSFIDSTGCWFWLKYTIGFGETENIVNFDNYNNNNNVHSFDILN